MARELECLSISTGSTIILATDSLSDLGSEAVSRVSKRLGDRSWTKGSRWGYKSVLVLEEECEGKEEER